MPTNLTCSLSGQGLPPIRPQSGSGPAEIWREIHHKTPRRATRKETTWTRLQKSVRPTRGVHGLYLQPESGGVLPQDCQCANWRLRVRVRLLVLGQVCWTPARNATVAAGTVRASERERAREGGREAGREREREGGRQAGRERVSQKKASLQDAQFTLLMYEALATSVSGSKPLGYSV